MPSPGVRMLGRSPGRSVKITSTVTIVTYPISPFEVLLPWGRFVQVRLE